MLGSVVVWLQSFVRLFFPRQCAVCGTLLQEGEEGICLRCNLEMPRTHYHTQPDNPVERMFWGKIPLERATAFFFYRKGSDFRQLLYRLKYRGRKDLGEVLGRFMAAELTECGFFQEVDVLLPVPLHARKKQKRGYNQSEYIARGVSQVTGIPLNSSVLVRSKNNETQTHKAAYERWENVEGIFTLLHPEEVAGKHVLLIDDVLTTGSTTTACADALKGVEGIRISVLSLAIAGD